MVSANVLAALAGELGDIASRLARLQEVPLLQAAGQEPLAGEALMRAMVAVQDLDRMAQDSAALAGFTRTAAEGGGDDYAVETALDEMPLRSMADRMRRRLADGGW